MFVQSEVHAKPGELMQGLLPCNRHFLLSNKSSRIFKSTTRISTKKTNPSSRLNYKSRQAVELFWSCFSTKKNARDISKLTMFTESNIPKGKGLSSSSADILSLLHALCIFYNTGYTTEKIYELAVVIEPTDPCLHADHLLFNQKQGEIIQSLDTLPFKLIYFDSDNDSTVDTISFSQSTTYTEELQQQYEQLCKTIALAFANSDYTTFHNCLITSAEINNCFLPKKNFHILQDFANAYNTGLFVAHSGTYMGLTVEPARFNTIKYAAFDLIKKNWNTSIYTE